MQIYMGNSFKNVDFVTKIGGFGDIEWMDWENYSDYNAARRL